MHAFDEIGEAVLLAHEGQRLFAQAFLSLLRRGYAVLTQRFGAHHA